MTKIVALIIAALVAILVFATPAEARQAKTTLCHATHSDTNPFVEITVANPAVFHAHDNHQDQEDIIPPYTFRGVDYPGQNFNAVTEAFLDNGCATPPVTSTTVPETTTTVPSTSTTVVQTTTTSAAPTTTTTHLQPVGTEDTTPTATATQAPPTQLAATGFVSTILKIALFLIVVGFLLGLVSRGRS